MTPEQAADVLDAAADVIERRGWATGILGWGDPDIPDDKNTVAEPDGPLCLEGGLCKALGMRPSEYGLGDLSRHPLFRLMAEYVDVEACDLWRWNDMHTEQEVLDALRAAAKSQRRQADG